MARRLAPFLLLLALAAPAPAGATADPVVYAHRGGAGLGPENTLGLFAATHAAYPGVWLELDVQLAKDGKLVVIHDATLDRTTTCTGPVVAKTSVELQSCNAADLWPSWGVQPVPTFRAVLEAGEGAAGWRIMPEIKNIPGEPNFDPTGVAAASALLADVAATGFDPERIIVQSFFPTSLDSIEVFGPEGMRTALLTTSQLPGAPPGAGFYATENGIYATARGYEITAPDHTSPDLSEETVAAIQALGREVVVWTVDAPAGIAAAVALGVNGIISNQPGVVYDELS